MFGDQTLKTHLSNSSTIELSSLVYAEINMNDPDNILRIGNYRNRPTEAITSVYVEEDEFTQTPKYYGYTDSDIVVDGGYDETENPTPLMSRQEKVGLYYSLEDCFNRFRPRSGINKASFYTRKGSHFLHNDSQYMMSRPRYYIADKNDTFKYWSSFRYQVDGVGSEMTMVARGISGRQKANELENEYIITDAAPFIVYKEAVPINRIVLKMQTHAGILTDNPAGIYDSDAELVEDPFYEDEEDVLNRSVPVDWSIQYLNSQNTWVTLKSFSSAYASANNPLIGRDGYFELQLNNGEWITGSDSVDSNTPMLSTFTDTSLDGTEYFSVKGIRVVVNTLSKKDYPFELIELSGRLAIDLTNMTKSYSIKKVAANLGETNLPVGQLLASTGQIDIADYELAFSLENENSIIAERLQKNVQFKFFEIIKNVSGSNVYIPIKTMYSDIFPSVDAKSREVSIELRDLFVQFESLTTPEIFIRNTSFSYAVAMVLDSIGFTNYIYKKSVNDPEPIIQDFFVEPNTSVAEVLQDLAVSTQTAMFFDEYNNLVLMSKSYMLPGIGDRPTDTSDLVLRGNNTGSTLANIIDIQSQEQEIYNAGKVSYTERYIQRTMKEIRQASLLDSDKTWIYKPVVLWEVSPTEQTKSENGDIQNQSAYSLAAIPLHSDLTASIPYVNESNRIVNNIMNLGEGVYWITRYNGYFYANGEIIKFDAVEYSVQGVGNVWVNSAEEYAEYFARVSFNGKIFPTGRIRIFVEPYYEQDGRTPKVGAVARHGRGQFNTKIVAHNAGISDIDGVDHWSRSANNINGVSMESDYLFNSSKTPPSTTASVSGTQFNTQHTSKTIAKRSKRVGKIRNFLSGSYFEEDDPNSAQAKATATVQSSALVFSGPPLASSENAKDLLSYVYRGNLKTETDGKPNHFGTRVRLIGQRSEESSQQIPTGAYPVAQKDDTKVSANSAGIAIMSSIENVGYFFEIAALSALNIEDVEENEEGLFNIMFYKLGRKSGESDIKKQSIPTLLWYGRSNILIDDGKFTGQYRMAKEENPTVYDLAVEYRVDAPNRDRNSSQGGVTFYLYLNNKLIGTVSDSNPIAINDTVALFVRGSTTAMFENVYAMRNNASANYFNPSETPLTAVSSFSKEDIIEESYRKYEMPRAISETYLTGISAIAPKKQNIWFEEFGTIMREMDYFNIKYDKAYPALAAKIAPTFNSMKGYAVSGFNPTAYGAEFMVFNVTDKAISLDETSGNWLRILGVTFTQQTDRDLTLDEYFAENGNLSDPAFQKGAASGNIILNRQNYQRIKNSIAKYGRKEFSIDALYIQNKAIAEKTMKFLIKNMTVPRISVGVEVFGSPHLQLGDIVSFDYKTSDNVDIVADASARFVVYSISHSRDSGGMKSTIYVSEVVD